ncbi:DNA replication and repair protein RecF [Anaplasma platys]|uniref:DNA replication and repair protein RecF n=1 Tax=Anaplasma platys TaxID=949 RepID=A0A858PZ78_9RICK|nr:DNA replication/repair protein RecF [Anaplasma platys]QJC27923.1 DNA replication and repair protein RecF [Anaplasma platys]
MTCLFQSFVDSIKLVNFRNYTKAELHSNGKSVVLLGENGAGKTNVLEALSVLSKGPGLRGVSAECMQNNASSTPWLVNYKIRRPEGLCTIDIARKNNQRAVTIDEKASLYSKLHSLLCIVWLVPQLDHILLKAPTERLRFFDRIVHIFDKDYSQHMVKYEKAKRSRKQLLREYPLNHNWLTSLENIMSISGVHIAQTRRNVLETLHAILLSHGQSSSFFKFSIQLNSKAFEFLNMPDAVQLFADNLKNSRETDAIRQCTTFGVHNDNFQIFHENKNLVASNCSTGEQKILLLSLLLTAAIAKHNADGQPPIMLLDDIMSHLDTTHREELMFIIKDLGCQAWITDVDTNNFNGFEKDFQYFHIEDNKISKLQH